MIARANPRRIGTLVVFLLAICGFSAWGGASARAAQVEHEQVVGGLHAATLEARINPEGVQTDCRAEYVARADFETTGWGAAKSLACDPEDLGSGVAPVSTSVPVGGLALSTVYRYRFLLSIGQETTAHGEGEFSTFGIKSFSFRTTDSAGEPDTQAGSHPYELITKLEAPTTEVEGAHSKVSPTGTIKDLLDELPSGLTGNPTAVARCTVREAESNVCTGDAQVGILQVQYGELTEETAPSTALYNTIPPEGTAARFVGEINGSADGFIDSHVRSDKDYGITSGGFNISGRTNVYAVTVRLWGVPANPGHDAERRCPAAGGSIVRGCSSTAPERPFLRNPTSCTGPLTVRARVDAYQSPGEFTEATDVLPAMTGCDQLGFDRAGHEPAIEVLPTSEVTDSPTGLHVDLHIPQSEDPAGLATPDLKDAVIKLPPGLTLNPSSANGLVGCTPAQFGLTTPIGVTPVHTTAAPAECPDASKIGTVEVDTPLLDHRLPGSIYVAEPYANPFDSLLAIYVGVADPESGVVIKLAGEVEIGAEGQLTTTFSDNPQLPFEDFKLDFFGGELAVLKTPSLCGTYGTLSTLTPWSAPASGPPATPSDAHPISQAAGGGACPTSAAAQPNSPNFEAGSESPIAGAFSPFVMHLSRPDGSQQFSALTLHLPPGLLGRLAGVPYCPDAALGAAAGKTGTEEREAPSCPEASRVGSVVVGAGAGQRPFYAAGQAYLAGPYKGAPLSLAIVTPAVAGPYDLGTVVVRAALEVDPYTTQITVKSDSIPTELKGIPLDVRSIAVKIDRSGFTLNPTNCEALAIGGTLTSTVGQAVNLSNRFQVGECRHLGFKPKLSLSLKGATKRAGHPALTATVTYPKGGRYANIARARVSLPHSEFLDQNNLNKVCSQAELRAAACPARSVYGHVRAWTPLLEKPLEGNVYLGVGFGYKLPALVAELNGQIRVLLKGKIDTDKRHGIRNTFETVPDAPVEKFVLKLKGGPKYGLLENSENICSKPQKAGVSFKAQNGRIENFTTKIGNSCKSGGAGVKFRS